MKKTFANPGAPHPLFVAALFCLSLYLIGIYSRPVFPVDETRYLTVAWEMFSTGDYILPHLNHQPYDHKPPLLFWSINALWHLFGISQKAAMAVPFLYAFALAGATYRLAKRMVPDRPEFAALTTYLLIGSLPFIAYSNMIMFDLMLGVFSVIGLTAVWDYAHTGKYRHMVLLAIALGLGAITKGPVILLHVLFPVLLVRFWIAKDKMIPTRAQWISGTLFAVIGGFAIGLSWAIPAAIKGGPEFADKIFWGQTAGRVTNSFDHKQPVYWYLFFLPIVLAPWIFSPLFWRGVRDKTITHASDHVRFIAIWVIPVFLSFCLISGKQVHYLLPLVPGCMLYFATQISRAKSTRPRHVIIPGMIVALLVLIPVFAKYVILFNPPENDNSHLVDIAGKVDIILPVTLSLVCVTLTLIAARKNVMTQILTLSVSCLLVMASFQIEAGKGYFRNYDLTPIANIIAKNPPVPLAFIRNYHGEWGFLARLDRPVKQMEPFELPQWFDKNPNGMAFFRTSHPEELAPYDIIFSMPYRTKHVYAIAVKRGMADKFVK